MTGRRSFWLGVFAIAYVCFAALSDARQTGAPLLALVLLPALLFELWRRTSRGEPGEYRIEKAAESSLRACAWGAALWIAARTGAPGRPSLDAAANLGAGVSAVAALVCLARIAPIGGLLTPHPSTRSLDAAGFTALLWGIAVAIPGTRALVPSGDLLLDPLAIDYATTTAGIGTLLVLVAASFRLRVQRRLEIGVADRAAAALALSVTALLVAVPAAAADIAAPDRILPIAVLSASAACCWTVTTREPTTVSIALRGVLAIMMLGVPTLLLVGVAAREAPRHSGAIALAGCVLSIVVGLIARAVARPLGPEQSRWLAALDGASRAALLPEPDAALRGALIALRGTATTPDAEPEIWRAEPPEHLSVDIAGNVQTQKSEAPARLYDIARDEPERTLRAEVIKALEVRRPDIRPLSAWFEMRRAFSATLIVDEEGAVGFILLPKGRRERPMTLEEARAVRILADRLSALLGVSSALSRARARELEAALQKRELEEECQRLEDIVAQDAGRHRAYAERIARPVRSSAYGAAARFALAELEKAASVHGNCTIVVPTGVDAIAWAAFAHLSSPRSGGPFVVVDATASAEHKEERWREEDSPLRLADGGTLVLTDLISLPLSIQDTLAELLAERAASARASGVPQVGLFASVHRPLSELLQAGRLSRALYAWIGAAEVALPALTDRPEDVRALVLDQLAGIGLRLRGEPFGIEPLALSALLDHSWPGNEAELREVLERAAARSEGSVVRIGDLLAIGFRGSDEQEPEPTAAVTAPSVRKRPRAATSVRRR